MKKMLASALIALMAIVPSLACCCLDEQQAEPAHHLQQGEDGHCDHHPAPGCASKVDMSLSSSQLSSHAHGHKPVFAPEGIALSSVLLSFGQAVDFADTGIIQHPPDPAQPVFLTTRRLRI